MKTTLLAVTALSFTVVTMAPAVTNAADAKPAGKKAGKGEKIDLGIPSFGAVPKGEGIEAPKEKKPSTESSTPLPVASYSVVRVAHGKSFVRSASGSTPSAPLEAVTLEGNPPVTEKFTTVVRVKSPDKKNAEITVAVMDNRGDTVMDANGQLVFRGLKTDEVDYTVDWDPTGVRGPGEFQVVVKVAGQTLGTFPLKVVEKK